MRMSAEFTDPSLSAKAAFERFRVRSRAVENQILGELGGSADDVEFAAAIHCPLSELTALAEAGTYLSLQYKGKRYWPRWQLLKGSTLPGLAPILKSLGHRHENGFSTVLFFITPTDTLHLSNEDRELEVRTDDSPLSLLRRAGIRALPLVLQHCERWGAHGAT